MADRTLRTAIAHEAARLLAEGAETDYESAKVKAARRLARVRWPDPDDLPSNAEVRQLVQTFEHVRGGDDPYPVFRLLLHPLAAVRQRAEDHPEGDALYHTLQVFELAKDHRPYDVEFLQAALLHDVGKAIEPHDHVAAGLRALDGFVSERTRFLIEHHPVAREYRDGTLTAKKRDRLRRHPDFDDLLLLGELDRAGRVPGARVGTLDEAIAYLRELEEQNG